MHVFEMLHELFSICFHMLEPNANKKIVDGVIRIGMNAERGCEKLGTSPCFISLFHKGLLTQKIKGVPRRSVSPPHPKRNHSVVSRQHGSEEELQKGCRPGLPFSLSRLHGPI